MIRGRWDIQDEPGYWNEPERLLDDTTRATVLQVRQDPFFGFESVREWEDTVLADWWDRHDVPSDAKVLEIGCGGGRMLLHWFKTAQSQYAGHYLHALDHAPGAVAVAKARLSQVSTITARTGGADRITELFPEIEFDVIFTHTALQHNGGTKQDRILPEIRRALKPGGLLFLWNEKTFTPEEDPHLGDIPPFYADDRESAGTAAWWVRTICGHGFELREYRDSSYTFRRLG